MARLVERARIASGYRAERESDAREGGSRDDGAETKSDGILREGGGGAGAGGGAGGGAGAGARPFSLVRTEYEIVVMLLNIVAHFAGMTAEGIKNELKEHIGEIAALKEAFQFLGQIMHPQTLKVRAPYYYNYMPLIPEHLHEPIYTVHGKLAQKRAKYAAKYGLGLDAASLYPGFPLMVMGGHRRGSRLRRSRRSRKSRYSRRSRRSRTRRSRTRSTKRSRSARRSRGARRSRRSRR